LPYQSIVVLWWKRGIFLKIKDSKFTKRNERSEVRSTKVLVALRQREPLAAAMAEYSSKIILRQRELLETVVKIRYGWC